MTEFIRIWKYSVVARMQRSGMRGDAPGLRFTPSGLRLCNCSAGVLQVTLLYNAWIPACAGMAVIWLKPDIQQM